MEKFKSQPHNREDVSTDAQNIALHAQRAISDGSHKASQGLLEQVHQISQKGPEHLNSVFKQVEKDSGRMNMLPRAQVDGDGSINFTAPRVSQVLGLNYREVSVQSVGGKTYVNGDVDRNPLMALGRSAVNAATNSVGKPYNRMLSK